MVLGLLDFGYAVFSRTRGGGAGSALPRSRHAESIGMRCCAKNCAHDERVACGKAALAHVARDIMTPLSLSLQKDVVLAGLQAENSEGCPKRQIEEGQTHRTTPGSHVDKIGDAQHSLQPRQARISLAIEGLGRASMSVRWL